MRKIIFVLLIIIMMSLNNMYATAETNTEKYITRGDCLSYIMLAIGTPGNGYSYSAIADYKEAPYCDFYMADNLEDAIHEFEKRSILTYSPDLVSVAIKYTNVVFGEYTSKEYDNKVYFGYIRYATLEEVLAFMVRCLEQSNEYNLADLKVTTGLAKEKGLLHENDAFYDNPKHIITLNDFKVLLSRFLLQQIYLCFDGPMYSEYKCSDEKMTYAECIINNYGNDYLEKLLRVDGLYNWKYD